MLVALIGSVPLVLISSFLIHKSISANISFGEQEFRGDAFQRPLEQLLDLLPRYQATAQKALAGNDSGRQEMADIQRQVDSAFDPLAANYNGKLGRALKFTDAELAARKRDNARLSVVQADWNNLKSASLAVAAGDELDGRLVTAVRAIIAHAGDLANLILDSDLDSDLDSYYLMDITLCALQQTQQPLERCHLASGRLAKIKGAVKTLLDIDKVVGTGTLELLQAKISR